MSDEGSMRAALIAALHDEQAQSLVATELDPVLERIWCTAHDAWPESQVSRVTLAAAAAARLPQGTMVVDGLRALKAADLYLALGCLAAERPALQGFEKILRSLRPTLARAGANAAAIDEVFGLLRIRLLVAEPGQTPKLEQYGARAPLSGWLRVAALREYQAQAKVGHRAVLADDAELELLLVGGTSPELEELRVRFRDQFRSAFGTALQSLTPKQRTVLRHHLLDKLSIDRIGALHDVHRATAARWLATIRDQLYAQTQAQFMRSLGLDSDEFKSLMGLVLSQLTYSIVRDLAE